MTDTQGKQTLLGEMVDGPLTVGEHQTAEDLHTEVMVWVLGLDHLEKEKRETFVTMCKNHQFSVAYLMLRQEFSSGERISIELMQRMGQWHTFTERGFVPTTLLPNT